MDRAYSMLKVKTVTEMPDEWVIEGTASTPTADRMNDRVDPMGAKFALPMALLWQHDSLKPIGRVEFAKPSKSGIPFVARMPKVKEAGVLQDRINEAVQSIKYRVVMAVSIGFRVLNDAIELIKETGGYLIKEWEWLELSVVTIPANPETTITSIKSIDDALLAASGQRQGGGGGLGTFPGASGTKQRPAIGGPSFTRSQKGKEMKTIAELRELREQKAARMNELVTLRQSENRKSTDGEADEFDALSDEVKDLDDEIRVLKMNAANSANARPVDGASTEGAARSRSVGGMSFVRKTDPEDKFKGQSYTRFLIAKACAFIAMKDGNYTTPEEVAKHRWGKTHPNLVNYVKAAVAGGGTGSGEWGAELAQSDTMYTGDFVDFLYGMTVFDRLPLRAVPARIHIKGQDGAATGYWVGESKGIPVSKPDFSDVELTPLKVGAIAACSKELVLDSTPAAELYIRDSLGQASAQRVDTTFLSATAASAGVSPAGILNGLSGIAASGTDAAAVRADLMSLYVPFLAAKNASGLVQIMTPSMAKAISLLMNALGQPEFPNLNADGGILQGDKVYTADNITSGNWILLKPSDIWKIGDGGVQVSMSDVATIEQNDAPQGASDTPTAASATLMSMWQEDSIAFKVVRRINFQKRRTSAVAFVQDGEYGGVVS